MSEGRNDDLLPPKQKIEGWINVFRRHDGVIWTSIQSPDDELGVFGSEHIARIPICEEYTEGDGL